MSGRRLAAAALALSLVALCLAVGALAKTRAMDDRLARNEARVLALFQGVFHVPEDANVSDELRRAWMQDPLMKEMGNHAEDAMERVAKELESQK